MMHKIKGNNSQKGSPVNNHNRASFKRQQLVAAIC